MYKILKIALPIPANKLFDYYASPPPDEDISLRRALVPLGRRTLTGFIVEDCGISEEKPEGLKQITELLDEEPAFSKNMLELANWISEYYMCSLGETLKAALPQGMSPQSRLTAEILRIPGDHEIEMMARRAPKRAELLKCLLETSGPVTVSYLEKALKTESVSACLEALEKSGIIKAIRVISRKDRHKFQIGVKIPEDIFNDDGKISEIMAKLDKSAPRQSLLFSAAYLHQKDTGLPKLLSAATRETRTDYSVYKALAKKGWLESENIEVNRNAVTSDGRNFSSVNELELTLTGEQQAAFKEISQPLSSGRFDSFLLKGVTGSGKTLVYMQAIEKAASLGKKSLLLVPEISLTPQLVDRFRAAFGDNIAALHSGLSSGERYDAWKSIRRGEAFLTIGARSAIFAPVDNLGLIIVDEEHDSSYKQDSPKPKYNARDIAAVRAKIENAPLVLGSATPSLESMHNAHSGKYKLLELNSRPHGAVMPAIRVTDMAAARKNKEAEGSFSNELVENIKEKLLNKEGIILFQNRRGFSNVLQCRSCGHAPHCKYCDVALTYHKKKEQLRCHYCGYTLRKMNVCLECGGLDLNEIGTGTQRIEEELSNILKNAGHEAVIDRMDRDTTYRKGELKNKLYSFATGESDILLGTQMVAKGLDFERVTLVGVINADLQLFFPDFRSSERTFQLITQVSGRAGRSPEKPGLVFVQSSKPLAPAILYSAKQDYGAFYEGEIKYRKELDYPPFSRFIVAEFSSKNEIQAERLANEYYRLLPQDTDYLLAFRPSPPSISRLKSYYRRIIAMKNIKELDPNGTKMRAALRRAEESFKKIKGAGAVRYSLDIDAMGNF